MDNPAENNAAAYLDTLPIELRLYILENLPSENLQYLSVVNKLWHRTIQNFFHTYRSLEISSLANTQWSLRRFSLTERISIRPGYPPNDNILILLATSPSCSTLRHIDLSVPTELRSTTVISNGLRVLANSPCASTLKSLNLNRVAIRFFAPLTRFTALTSLQLNSVGNLHERNFSTIISACTRLEELDLGSTMLTDNVLVELSKYCTSLRSLSVEGCSRGVTGKTLGQLFKGCSMLTRLDLGECYRIKQIEDFTSFALNATELRWLSLYKCIDITNEFISVLCANCKKLQYLNISGCERLTNESLHFIAQLPAIKEIKIGLCQMITKGAIEDFEELHPHVRVFVLRKFGFLNK